MAGCVTAAPRKASRKAKSKTRKKADSRHQTQSAIVYGKREGQARKTNFIQKKANQSLAYKNQQVAPIPFNHSNQQLG